MILYCEAGTEYNVFIFFFHFLLHIRVGDIVFKNKLKLI